MTEYIPEINSYVKVYFNNGYVEEGFVIAWGSNIVLKNKIKEEYSIITDLGSIFLFKILPDIKPKEMNIINDVFVDEELKPSVYHKTHTERATHLSKLREQRTETEKDLIRQKLTTFSPTYNPVIYDTQESVLFHTAKKDR